MLFGTDATDPIFTKAGMKSVVVLIFVYSRNIIDAVLIILQCLESVHHWSKAEYKGFPTLIEAQRWLQQTPRKQKGRASTVST